MASSLSETRVRTILFDAYGTLFTGGISDDPTTDLHRSLSKAGVKVKHQLLATTLKMEMAYYRRNQRAIRTQKELDKLRLECGQIIVDGIGGAKVCHLTNVEMSSLLVSTFPSWIFSDVHKAIKRARDAGCSIGVLSNFSFLLPVILEELGIANLFDFIIHSAGVGFEKPHPRIFHVALEKADVAPYQAALIGDTYEEDIVGASTLGMIGVLLDRSKNSNIQHNPTACDLPQAVELALSGTTSLELPLCNWLDR